MTTEQLQAEVARLRFMLEHVSHAPTLEAARTVCRDALNGVGGAYNVGAVRSEVEKLRAALTQCVDRIEWVSQYLQPIHFAHALQAAEEALGGTS